MLWKKLSQNEITGIRRVMDEENFNEFLYLVAGGKKIVRLASPFLNWPAIKKICLTYGLFFLLKEINNFYGGGRTAEVAYLSRDKNLAQRAYEAEKNRDRLLIGKLLGYPDCCVRRWLVIFKKEQRGLVPADIYRSADRPINFYLNNLFNFNGRPDQEKVKNYCELVSFHLITHQPCSYQCQLSLALSRKNWRILQFYDPTHAARIKKILLKPALYLDNLNCFVFDGQVDGNGIFYRSLTGESYYDNNVYFKKLVAGNGLKIDKKQIKIFKNNKLTGNIKTDQVKKSALVFNFQ